MKINELGNINNVNEGIADAAKTAGNWLVRKGALGATKGFHAQQQHNREVAGSEMEKSFVDRMKTAYTQAVSAGIVTPSVQPQAQTQATSNTEKFQQTGPIMSNDPDAKAKLAALPPRTQGNVTAQDAAARAGLTSNSDPRRNAGYTQAKNRQGTAGGPVITGTTAAGPMTNGPTGGTAHQPTPRSNVQKLDQPMSDQQLRDIEANRQRMKESVLEGAYSEFDALIESIMSEDDARDGMTPAEWVEHYLTQMTVGQNLTLPPKSEAAIKSLAATFQQQAASGKFPTGIAKKLYAYYATVAASQPKKSMWDNERTTGASTANTPTPAQQDYISDIVKPVIQSNGNPDATLKAVIGLVNLLVVTGADVTELLGRIQKGVAELQKQQAAQQQNPTQ